MLLGFAIGANLNKIKFKDQAKGKAKASPVLKYGFIKNALFFALFQNNLNTLRVRVLKQTETPGCNPSVSLGSAHPCTVR